MQDDDLEPLGKMMEQIQENLQNRGLEPGLPAPEEYDCTACRDIGFVHPRHASGAVDYGALIVPCDCQLYRIEESRKARLMTLCELPIGTEGLTFGNFAQVPGTAEAYDLAFELAQGGANAIRWLTLVSPPDRGKTHLAIAACRHRIDMGQPALYRFVPDLLRELRKGFDNHDYDERFERYCEVPLLALDDLGAENQTPWVQEQIDSIIDHRYVRRLPLIITTNLKADQLAHRVRSRIQRATWGRVITITSGEYRLVNR